MFRMKYPLSWTFHRNSSSWLPSILAPMENQQETAAFKEMVDLPAIKLPPPQALHRELSETIRARYSCRRFIDAEVPLSALATLLYWSYGKLGIDYPNGTEMVLRPVPSGGGLYPLELYVIALRMEGLEPGIYHYNILGHFLEALARARVPDQVLSELFLRQPYVAQSAFVLVLTAVFDRSLWKYRDRGYRYLLMEAGHVAQNANLAATALGLASLNLGGFIDVDLITLLKLEGDEEAPLYVLAVGQPENAISELNRIPEQPLYT
jgi:SagB-type dehydrogenase family enzyme